MTAKRSARVLSTVAALVPLACGGGARPAPPPAPAVASPGCAAGILATTGTQLERQVRLDRPEADDPVLVGGDQGAFVALAGAVVEVCGNPGTRMQEPILTVRSWRLVSVDGMEAYTGTLHVVDGGGWTLDGVDLAGTSVPLTEVPSGLGMHAGRRVWVAGAWDGAVFAARSYGVLGG